MADNDKVLGASMPTVGRFALGGAGVGAGAALAVNLAKMLKDMSDTRKPPEEDDNTIVVNLPRKRADAIDLLGELKAAQVNAASGVGPGEPHLGASGPNPSTDSEGAPDEKEKGADQLASLFNMGLDATQPANVRTTRASTKTSELRDRHHDGQFRHGHAAMLRDLSEGGVGSPDGNPDNQDQPMAASKTAELLGVKSANWQTMAAALLAAGAGGAIGYNLSDKVMQAARVRRLRKDLTKARTEYIKTLGPDEAEASAVKDAQHHAHTFNKIDYPLGLTALLTLLGAGGTAWLTKRILDEKFRQPDLYDKVREGVGARKIVFRTPGAKSQGELAHMDVGPEAATPEDKAEAEAAAKSAEFAALGVMMDIVEGAPRLASDPDVVASLEKCGHDAAWLYKSADVGDDYYTLLATLGANPELRKTIQRAAWTKAHPVIGEWTKFLAGVPGISGLADDRLYSELRKNLEPDQLKTEWEQSVNRETPVAAAAPRQAPQHHAQPVAQPQRAATPRPGGADSLYGRKHASDEGLAKAAQRMIRVMTASKGGEPLDADQIDMPGLLRALGISGGGSDSTPEPNQKKEKDHGCDCDEGRGKTCDCCKERAEGEMRGGVQSGVVSEVQGSGDKGEVEKEVTKKALLDMRLVSSALYGGTMAGQATKNELRAEHAQDAALRSDEAGKPSPASKTNPVHVEADDPQAAEYLKKHAPAIREAIQKLKAQGKL